MKRSQNFGPPKYQTSIRPTCLLLLNDCLSKLVTNIYFTMYNFETTLNIRSSLTASPHPTRKTLQHCSLANPLRHVLEVTHLPHQPYIANTEKCVLYSNQWSYWDSNYNKYSINKGHFRTARASNSMNTYPQTDFQLKARTLSTSKSPAHTDVTHAHLSNHS